ncbi:MAG: SPOR domain-containing protein [Alphaproteobacteria bacterium]|nr:SPOR domain-containing protein [Alphaproteobacteria bacterium]
MVTAAPRPTVTAQVTTQIAAAEPTVRTDATIDDTPRNQSRPPTVIATPSTDVSVTAPQPGALYVQAGSFVDPANAVRLKSLLRPAGDASVTPAEVNAKTFYRVRLGPARTLAEADALLAQVIELGYSGARIVVE